jgi:hypothetical protein
MCKHVIYSWGGQKIIFITKSKIRNILIVKKIININISGDATMLHLRDIKAAHFWSWNNVNS